MSPKAKRKKTSKKKLLRCDVVYDRKFHDWKVRGHSFSTKARAVVYARNLQAIAIRFDGYTGVTMRVHGRDGRFQYESTFPRSADPRRSKG